MKLHPLLLLLLPALLTAQPDSISAILQQHVNHSGKHKVHSVLFYLEQEREGFLYQEGFGLTQKQGDPITRDAPFRIASITKTFVATIIMQLMEEGKLQLDDHVIPYLQDVDFLDISNIYYYEKESYATAITIEHLLSHRSGLADIFHDKALRFYTGVYLNKRKQYSPEIIVRKYYRYRLHQQAHFPPGTDFFYSDMNYVLLGLLIQEIEQRPLAAVIRSRILEPLQMQDTFFEFYEPATGDQPPIHQYRKRMDMTQMNTSFDWAGGGLVSTTTDLAIFVKALFGGQLINEASLQQMTAMRLTGEYHNRYGLGLYESEYNGDIYYGHYGFYGSYLGYCPVKKTILAYNISQVHTDFYAAGMIEEVLRVTEASEWPTLTNPGPPTAPEAQDH